MHRLPCDSQVPRGVRELPCTCNDVGPDVSFAKDFAAYGTIMLQKRRRNRSPADIAAVWPFVMTAEKLGINRGSGLRKHDLRSSHNAAIAAWRIIYSKCQDDLNKLANAPEGEKSIYYKEAKGEELSKEDTEKLRGSQGKPVGQEQRRVHKGVYEDWRRNRNPSSVKRRRV